MLRLLARVKGTDWTVVAHYARPNFTALTLFLRELIYSLHVYFLFTVDARHLFNAPFKTHWVTQVVLIDGLEVLCSILFLQ